MTTGKADSYPPLLDWKSISIITASIIWAANATNIIEVADFLENLLHGWRDFFRFAWDWFFDLIHLPVEFAPHQKDVLTLFGFLLGGAVFRKLFRIHPHAFFKPAFYEIGTSFSNPLIRILILLLYAIISIGIVFLVMFPFFDTVEFTHDLFFIIVIFAGYSVLFGAFSVVKWIYNIVKSDATLWEKVLELILTPIFIALFGGIFILILVGLDYLMKWLLPQDFIVPQLIELDSEPFDFRDYVTHLNLEKTLDTAFLVLTPFILMFATGRSLRPLVQLLIYGVLILLAGAFLNAVIEQYPGAFK